ncbi:ExeA family protein [Alkaliphilus serpentinus]|uniref:AAA family ATPase n=1 Tax=Alkaliphilus serpentinus TaxID=1482731 RepID=A0A833HL31_9FIRM|nr:AAA family ATPase [Alkaliphilus serpentinus]KAB3524774.1 AAA family ATPase [Alkaliphilus serpentinus]
MSNSFYGLTHNPFDKQLLREADSFKSKDFDAMMARLGYLKDIRGIGVFTASPGMGKSYALRCFAKSLNDNLHQIEYLCLSTISVSEFYKQLCILLGLDTKGGKTAMFKSIQDRIHYLYKERRKPLILAIDEAQYLSPGILKDLKMLMNHGYDSLNCFTLILAGEPHLNNTLEKPIHEALKQRITVHYNYQGLDDEVVKEYIHHKLTVAGASKSIIDESAVSAAHSYSRGNPRLLDNVMSHALDLGSQKQQEIIDAELMMVSIEAQSLF